MGRAPHPNPEKALRAVFRFVKCFRPRALACCFIGDQHWTHFTRFSGVVEKLDCTYHANIASY